VQAKRGRALLWPSVLDFEPDVRDPRTDHQALPVVKGVKYGANVWLHQRDFKAPFAKGCI
jgi:prolyl 4-hydroxylase